MLQKQLNTNIDLDCVSVNYKRKNNVIGIYKITSPTGKINIGQSINIENRLASNYKVLKCKNQNILYHSLKKHGVKEHSFQIIHIIEQGNLTKEEIKKKLNILEVYYIKKLNSFYDDNKEFGMNLTRGGNSGVISESVKAKISKTLTGRKLNLDKETILKKSLLMQGEKNPMYGKFGKEHNAYGIKRSPETIKKIVAANIGRKLSKESIQKSIETRKKNFQEKIKNGYVPRSEFRKRKREEKLKDGYVRPKRIISEETKIKQRNQKLGKKLKIESIIKREKTKKLNRENNIKLGIIPKKQFISLETRIKISQANKGKNLEKKHSQEQNMNHSKIMTGRKQSPETILKRAITIKRIKQERLTMVF